MLFNSLEFFVFLGLIWPIYRLIKLWRWQNYWLLFASYIFYGSWDWRFLGLIFISTVADYYLARAIYRTNHVWRRRCLLWSSVSINLGILGFFKYYHFFIDSLLALLATFDLNIDLWTLQIILPMGISFYTFQTMSYTMDVYRGRFKPIRHFGDFALYVSFFPQLVAGPIERAERLIPQIKNPRQVNWQHIKSGLYLIYFGLFMKVFVADNLAQLVNPVFAAPDKQNGAMILVACYAFAFQIFCDFAGYSSMARGIAKLFGFELMLNFNLPYFASNPQDFWRRWHISLSTWLRDYLYIPLGGSKQGPWQNLRNLMIVMVLGGLWHGAAWTFIVWGFYHGLLLIGHRLIRQWRVEAQVEPWLLRGIKIVIFFHFVVIGWIFFRAQSLGDVGIFWQRIIFATDWNMESLNALIKFVLFVFPLWFVNMAQKVSQDLMVITKQNAWLQIVIYAFMAYLILGWGILDAEEFIYFQF